ncbi:adenylylsulfate kinase : Sulfate adenylyltransferase subunit 1 OS=Singulisphaera acidiphila (strain ATCC BAA-1392 / DSM 18658 / VKM B-2454 / MOB10) GN=cysN PE=3 SV=1: GTP_EFTU: GTP_EFTU_D2: APS_kinase [Gemmataceae bacterium]|nr:adenylylsulfate kinase : Sulfate adenylyltransferase subunit 1 OS=Singulisphaera acidiphila (strain ATCC BAA-1392 / DSM 18658 / VKM B-2454 / MOB10) GN=cysN PE=3 SV=1: GTP_EFTU: GTP_EFTU_D2: APS_kinase [Gemmataceae bacterium]VTT97071.1 adenylylsulfate kinase : Sulfate adenylyltransferase subunit 1 OS=Singulisphaera acidiphila (strain ATCC BAA-1392 / DSM 18658 / VKM B-2454 / MOB10) GN=cysN PE=3 SV=1: GTP_EFTU: GTP_EFTU_D2: APS_kinase [Gemmataceae bacterium]
MQAVDLANEDIHSYLARHQKKELLRFLTCGSVDDGKSTLIGRLLHDTKMIYEDQLAAVKRDSEKVGTTGAGEIDLALLTDGLKAEREQGITIDVAYRYFSTDRRKFIIADTPGHEQYTRNMATGASTCQLAIILIDARHGVQTQTRRHSFIVSLLGIRHVVVAINKMDLVGHSQEVFERIRAEYTGFVAKLDLPDITFIPMSALKGDNVAARSEKTPWYHGPALLDHLETVHIASDRNLADLRFPVQYVIRPNLDFRGFAGTIASGTVRTGDEVMVLPSGKRSRVKSIVTYDGDLDEAFAPQAVTLTLADEVDVSRGDMLVRPDSPPHVSSQIEAMVVWMAEQPLVPGRTYTLKHTTRQVSAEVGAFRYGVDVNTLEHRAVARLGLNEVGLVQLSLTQPLACDPYRTNAATGAFILIDRLTNTTVGAGMIQEAGPPRQAESVVTAKARDSLVAPAEREQRFGQKPVTVLLVGLTGSGKSRIAYALERKLWDEGRAVTVLYGQNMRHGLNRDLGFTADDRSENLRRSAEVAKLMNDAGVITIAAFVAPHASVREKAKQVIGADRVLEVYCTAPMDVLRSRDQSGAYKLADEGKIAQMPGVTAAFEEPTAPDLVLNTDQLDVDASVARIIDLLKAKGYVR